ncbi:glycoside hydrolase family 16 protein [Wenyingzhuangia aestuarii]|uniref:glycoside hydrolase family 16 protein n=1 Tax=Wenyingzhuangia aestuarii TaxID=1647582 RepID=UPI00143ADA70|nr:glycoside hydrolase family 16 protein [Wenyingzhuangia aestuarii]NJB82547.1 beta-glucanase (GH16 family) [Wenyingzhuangia aestuarii]
MKYTKIWIKSMVLACLFSCACSKDKVAVNDTTEPTVACPGKITNAVPNGNNNVLVWSDEFNTAGSPCTENWTYDIGNSGWGNNELQYYTRDNAVVENGILKITAKKETYRGAPYTSARMKTQDRFSFTYGKVEVRAKLPYGLGTWPAIWMLGDNISTVGWPTCGEIDIMERAGTSSANLKITTSAIHNSSGYGNTPYVGENEPKEDLSTEFHLYSINWTADKIEFMVDNVVHYTYQPATKDAANWPFDKNQFVILNVAMGGTLGGNVDPDFTESAMEIDYVRVYQ